MFLEDSPHFGQHRTLLDGIIPVLGTLAGAFLGGGVSLFTQRLSARYARETQLRNIGEERARWAVEKKLSELKKLYGQVTDFLDSTGEFRMRQARAFYLAGDKEVPHITLKAEYDSARARWETALTALHEDILIFDIDFYTMLLDALKPRQEWFFAKTEEEGIRHLLALEENLRDFARRIAEHHRQVFSDRQSGRDV